MLDTRAARAEGRDAFLVGGARAGGGVSVWSEGRHGRGAGGASFFGDVGAGTRFYIGDLGRGVRLFSAVRVRVATSSSSTGAATGTGHGSLIVGDILFNYVGLSDGVCGGGAAQHYGSFVGGEGGGGGGSFSGGLFAGSRVGLQPVSVSS